ncbi:MAG TPA: dethiobiotin synthase [Gammaproteobacteria bacterium]|nr:dethiobiotin synthase [Gammaproteobacteria bacterium]
MAAERGYFVTGTDTEIGKTIVSAALIRALNRRGRRTVGMKPVASGCIETADGLRNEDAVALMNAAAADCPYEDVNPYAFVPPIAPHIAADEAGVSIEFGRVQECHERLAAAADCVVVEGVGGWTVPLNADQSVADLAVALDLPVVLVVGMRLGCLNHALLTAESMRRAGVRCAGWVANDLDGAMGRLKENVATLQRMMPFPMIARVPVLRDPDKAEIEFDLTDPLPQGEGRVRGVD